MLVGVDLPQPGGPVWRPPEGMDTPTCRADHLHQLADQIDAIVESILPNLIGDPQPSGRDEVWARLLARTVHQLHTSSAELRLRADDLVRQVAA